MDIIRAKAKHPETHVAVLLTEDNLDEVAEWLRTQGVTMASPQPGTARLMFQEGQAVPRLVDVGCVLMVRNGVVSGFESMDVFLEAYEVDAEEEYGSNAHLRRLGYFQGLYHPMAPQGYEFTYYKADAEGPNGSCSFPLGHAFGQAVEQMKALKADPENAKYTDWLLVRLETAGRMTAIAPEDYPLERNRR